MKKKAGSKWMRVWLLAFSLLVLAGQSGCGLKTENVRISENTEVTKERDPAEGKKEAVDENIDTGAAGNETEQKAKSEAAEVQEQEDISFVYDSTDRYVYGTLDDITKKVYDEIFQAISEQKANIPVSTLDVNVLDSAYKAVTADYGGIFWVSGYVYTQYTKGDALVGLDFAPKYTMTESVRLDTQQQIDAKVEEILAGISMEATDYEKAKYVFEYLAANVDYEIGSQDNQNIISVFLYQKTVCQGYASATQYLLDRLGIQSAVVTGKANGESHAWNLVRMDGEYYYIDTTWGNSAYTSEQSGIRRFINYNYFGVTSEELMRTHSANDYFALPYCTAVTDNYYVREGKYFSEWTPDAVGTICRETYEAGQGAVSVKFSTSGLFGQMKQYFIDEEHIADYCSGISSLYYVEDTKQNVLTFNFS